MKTLMKIWNPYLGFTDSYIAPLEKIMAWINKRGYSYSKNTVRRGRTYEVYTKGDCAVWVSPCKEATV